MGKSTIVLRGDLGTPKNNYSKLQLWDVTDSTALNTLQSTISSHTGCHVAKTSFPEEVIVNDVAPGASVNVDRRVELYIRDNADGKVFCQEYPSPVAADTELVAQGERLTAAAVSAITGLIATLTGKTLTGLWGKVVQKG